MTQSISFARSLAGGAVGAAVLTTLHQGAQLVTDKAPRMDVVAERALRRGLKATGQSVPKRRTLFWTALAGDLVANTLYYAIAGKGGRKSALARGAAFGLAAGIGGVLLPERLGLGRMPQRRTAATSLMTVAWYLAGGLVAAAASQALTGRD